MCVAQCDLAKPACSHCRRRKEHCEGYQPEPHTRFIHYLTPRSSTEHVDRPRTRMTDPRGLQGLLIASQLGSLLPHKQLPLAPEQRSMIISSLMYRFAPTIGSWHDLTYSQYHGQQGRWLPAAIELTQTKHTSSIEHALLSLGLMTVGRRTQNLELASQSRQEYQKILSYMHHIVGRIASNKHRNAALTRECIVLILLCTKIEFAASGHVDNAHRHRDGALQLLALAGPSITADRILYHTICEFRVLCMATQLLFYNCSIFNSPAWRYSNWMPPDPMQQDQLQLCLDIGFQMTTVSEQLRRARLKAPSTLDVEHMHLLLDKMKSLSSSLTSWMDSQPDVTKHWTLPVICIDMETHLAAATIPQEIMTTWTYAYMLKVFALEFIINLTGLLAHRASIALEQACELLYWIELCMTFADACSPHDRGFQAIAVVMAPCIVSYHCLQQQLSGQTDQAAARRISLCAEKCRMMDTRLQSFGYLTPEIYAACRARDVIMFSVNTEDVKRAFEHFAQHREPTWIEASI